MTTITTPAVWYPAAALPTLIATVGAVFIVNRVTDYLQSCKLKRQQKDQSGSHRGINWNVPWSWLVKTINTRFVGRSASNTATIDKAQSSSPGPPSQKQPEYSIRTFDEPPQGQQQPILVISNEESPGHQPLHPSTRILDEHFLRQKQPYTGVPDRPLKSTIGSYGMYPRHIGRPGSPEIDYRMEEKNQISGKVYGYRVKGVARVDSDSD